jgi:hypothetical protein
MEVIRCHPTATLPAVFRMEEHLKRLGRPELAEAILQALEAHGFEDAYVYATHDSVLITRVPPATEAAVFYAKGGRWFAAPGRDSVTRDTLMNLTGAGEAPMSGEPDEMFEADASGIRPVKNGPMTRVVQQRYRSAMRGELPGYEHWLTHVGRILV